MLKKKPDMFRQKSIERLSSPERLDQLMKIVSPKSWLPLFAFGSIVAVGLTWSIYGKIPVTVDGKGVLIYPKKVVPLESKTPGQLLALNIKVGDMVTKGQVLATIDQSELRKQLQQQQTKLKELDSQNNAVGSLQGQRLEQEKISMLQQKSSLQQRIGQLQAMTPLLKVKNKDSIKQQRIVLRQRIQQAQALAPVYQQRWSLRKELSKQRAISSDLALSSEQEYIQNQQKISELQSQFKDLEVREAEQEKAYRENISSISDLQSQLKQIDSRQASIAQQDLESSTVRKREMQEVRREIARLELQLSNNSQIISQHNGRILELTVSPGQVVNAGTRLGSINEQNADTKLVGISYFPVAEGKKVQPGMQIQITPQTVKRERFGGIVGSVTNISQFPITKEGANNIVGNSELVEGLISKNQEGVMQVFAELEVNSATPTGYKWSSSTGPVMKISSGTTTTVRVKVEERAPITFLLPILREFSGIY
ncbi:MAG: NHLP bacteriocin system secretion protein [Scytonematopsis contorta HA4267-MV1]|jgi:HlyD family secretion protein|nr:NHLP bacteriocin system secretion protein [Scytonematopsis contorta HA4267-MV1]